MGAWKITSKELWIRWLDNIISVQMYAFRY